MVKLAEKLRLREYRAYLLPFLLAAAILLVFFFRLAPMVLESPFNGVWFYQSGERNMPAEIKLSLHSGIFKQVYWAESSGHYETISIILDGQQHVWSQDDGAAGLDIVLTYRAQRDGKSLVITRFFQQPDLPPTTTVERWELQSGGTLSVSNGRLQAVYKRASWLRTLFTGEP